MQRLRRALAALLATAGCSSGAGEPAGDLARYLDDPAFRRAELEASLVDPADGYAQLRLAHYGLAWEALPVWNARVEPVTRDELGPGCALQPLGPGARALPIGADASAGDERALRSLGWEAFFRYPVQLLPDAATALASPDAPDRYGLFTDPATGSVGGLVHAEMADGSTRVAITCATCHTALRDGGLAVGVPNAALDLGRLAVDAGGVPPDLAARLLGWGPGRIDVSSHDGSEPARIPDLRPVRFLTHLHQDATVKQRSVVSLALRLETLVVTSHDQDLRPPREAALGLALAVWSLADGLPSPSPSSDAAARGLEVHRQACASCHAPDAFTGPPVPLSVAGTDPTLGLSLDRGTGFYRVPSLRGVGTRGPLLHDASAPDLAVFFDPARVTAHYQGGRSRGRVPGHPFNIELPAADREALLTYLQGL